MTVNRPSRAFAHAEQLRAAGRIAEALVIYRDLYRHKKDDAALLASMGTAEAAIGDHAAARGHLARAVQLDAGDTEAWFELAQVLRYEEKLERAGETLDRALALHPAHPQLTALRAEYLAMQGRHEEAGELIRPLVGAGEPDAALALVYATLARPLGRVDASVEYLRRTAGDTSLHPAKRGPVLFRLAQLLEHAGAYEEAWSAAAEANSLISPPFDPARHEQAIDSLISSFTPDRLAGVHKPRTDPEQVVFIVAMPRSGTSLTEQILSRHPEVHAGGELTIVESFVAELARSGHHDLFAMEPRRLDRLAESFRRRYRRLAPGAARITDKMPANMVHLGLISLLMPGARVIHCRRDPLDTCVSCFFQYWPRTNNFIYDLHHLGVYARSVARLMEHWKSVLDLRIHDVVYEELVNDQERVTRDLLGFLGLGWHDDCLSFHESGRATLTASAYQVQQKMYDTSIGRYQHYERHLGPLRRALEGEP